MEAIYYIKTPPKRRIPKGRVSRKHHYVMAFPEDFGFGKFNSPGMPYIFFFDSFLEDCVARMSLAAPELFEYDEHKIGTACLN